MDKTVPVFRRVSRGVARDRAAEVFDSYCHRRWGSGSAANAAAAPLFDADGKTVGRWRDGITRVPGDILVMALTFERIDGVLDYLAGGDRP